PSSDFTFSPSSRFLSWRPRGVRSFWREARFLTLSLPWLFPIRPPPSPFRGRYQVISLNPFLRSDFRLPISDLWLSPSLNSAMRAFPPPLYARSSSSPCHRADSAHQNFHPSSRLAKT